MKVEELTPDLFAGCPRYLTQQRFAELAGLQEQEKMLIRWCNEGIVPTRRFGRHRLIDMQALLQRLDPTQETQG
ncbi:DNA-binding protein [Pseudomonas sp. sp1636]|uniref:DNA-binding protein n=1 Tax=Pseudomonas sp. sp1636 TaxID=3036707 RepID=UPI0025A64106|nr:DNA-binding protein [Pseudomonas sp. sp1636]MDM8349777.1 DNA-binding protein [Pseudomonas sp. sp1636]